MKWTDSLDEVMGTTLKVRLARILCNSDEPQTGMRLAKAAGYSHTQTYKALGELEEQGVVSSRASGASYLYSVNRDSYVVREILMPALRAERGMIRALTQRFYDRLGEDLLSVVVFGSVARKEDQAGSDIDLILVCRDQSDVEKLEFAAAEVSLEASHEFGGSVSAFVFPEKTYKQRLKQGKAMWNDVRRTGVPVARGAEKVASVG
jgi:predicted nucleotidyltransferase/biotin operon repressor